MLPDEFLSTTVSPTADPSDEAEPSESAESPESASLVLEMPRLASDTYTRIPLLLPEVGPEVSLELVNDTGDAAWVVVWSRMIEGVEVG